MSNGKDTVRTEKLVPFERAVWLWAKIVTFIITGKRKANEVADWLQVVVSEPQFAERLRAPRNATTDTAEPSEGWAMIWERFYFEVFGLTVDLSGVSVSPYQSSFGWVVYVLKELTLNQLYAKCRCLFPCSSDYGDDLDLAIPTEDYNPHLLGNYARRFRNRVEPDEETKNMSANELTEADLAGNTLREALVLELFYFWLTGGGHLNLVNANICAGSRTTGYVPRVIWEKGQFYVSRCSPNLSREYLRSRVAVS